MTLYLDDDIASPLLTTLLRKAGHDVVIPSDIGMAAKPDPAHLKRAIRDARACVTKNYDDFLLLHELILEAGGTHPGILVVRQENNPARDLTPKGIAAAIRKLEAAGVPIVNEYIVLNHWTVSQRARTGAAEHRRKDRIAQCLTEEAGISSGYAHSTRAAPDSRCRYHRVSGQTAGVR